MAEFQQRYKNKENYGSISASNHFGLKIIGIEYLTAQQGLKNSHYFIDSNRIRKN